MNNISTFQISLGSDVDSGGAGGARATPEFEGSEKGRSLISAFWSLAITASTPGFENYLRRCWDKSKVKHKLRTQS